MTNCIFVILDVFHVYWLLHTETAFFFFEMMSFVCHVEHPHKFISNYLATLETPPELRQEAWNLANDSLRTTLCVRFRSEVVACGVVYAAARRFQVPLPETPPWWKAFDADKSGIDQVCSVLAHLYSLPKAQYISVCKDGKTFTFSSRSGNPQAQSATKDVLPAGGDAGDTKGSAVNEFKDEVITTPHEKATNSKKREAESNSLPIVGDSREKKS
ncbi:cyclin-L1-1 isoform X5 [Brassica rapa]|uniref:cyclin-L1-1 isoform X5 n=1 Tax=Brassica campestris TaxID=3711 RepID=UPI00142D6046|nr:cyclin-L1-1 isoform X5 [Brassica rapa]XP_033134949.1 cyclin-L1-1 isoform X5 [Brassica rapa]XP_033134950.1 cyclin-L1-1 isoform X5 [Brassica rapa]XP_033134951.1 cyclin-L1-1 isoform X5 [Brassica rapa]